MADINVTPLVDVMLVLLIIFMITAPLMTHKVKVKLPQATSEHQAGAQDAAGDLGDQVHRRAFWNDEPVNAAQLDQKLGVLITQVTRSRRSTSAPTPTPSTASSTTPCRRCARLACARSASCPAPNATSKGT